LVQVEGEVETLRVVVSTSVLDGEGIAPKPLYWVLLRVVLGDPQRLEFLWKQQIAVGDRPRGPLKQWGNPHLNPHIEMS
jgi:hypothetical protein